MCRSVRAHHLPIFCFATAAVRRLIFRPRLKRFRSLYLTLSCVMYVFVDVCLLSCVAPAPKYMMLLTISLSCVLLCLSCLLPVPSSSCCCLLVALSAIVASSVDDGCLPHSICLCICPNRSFSSRRQRLDQKRHNSERAVPARPRHLASPVPGPILSAAPPGRAGAIKFVTLLSHLPFPFRAVSACATWFLCFSAADQSPSSAAERVCLCVSRWVCVGLVRAS